MQPVKSTVTTRRAKNKYPQPSPCHFSHVPVRSSPRKKIPVSSTPTPGPTRSSPGEKVTNQSPTGPTPRPIAPKPIAPKPIVATSPARSKKRPQVPTRFSPRKHGTTPRPPTATPVTTRQTTPVSTPVSNPKASTPSVLPTPTPVQEQPEEDNAYDAYDDAPLEEEDLFQENQEEDLFQENQEEDLFQENPEEDLFQENQEEDHDNLEEDQEYQEEDLCQENQQEEEHHEEEDLPPNADGKIPIGVSDLILDFMPRKAAFAKLKEIIHGHFNGPWHCISMVPIEVKNMWFTEFQKSFCWTVANPTMRRVFLFQAGRHLSNVLKPYFKKGNQPFFVKDIYWKTMLENKATPAAIRRSEVNRTNRNSPRSTETGNYHGGSRKDSKWMKVMEKEKGAKPLISELVRKLWSKDKNGTDLGTATAAAVADFEGFVSELPSSASVSINKQIELWLRATKGLRNGRIMALGELGSSLVRCGLIDDISCSIKRPEEILEPLKEEIMVVRGEMKALRAENKELKDMLALVIQKVQGGASTSQ